MHEVAQHVQVHELAQDDVPKQVQALHEVLDRGGELHEHCLPVREGRLGQ